MAPCRYCRKTETTGYTGFDSPGLHKSPAGFVLCVFHGIKVQIGFPAGDFYYQNTRGSRPQRREGDQQARKCFVHIVFSLFFILLCDREAVSRCPTIIGFSKMETTTLTNHLTMKRIDKVYQRYQDNRTGKYHVLYRTGRRPDGTWDVHTATYDTPEAAQSLKPGRLITPQDEKHKN